MKANNQNSISINGTGTGPNFIIYVLLWYIIHIAEQSLHDVMDVKFLEYQESPPARAIHWILCNSQLNRTRREKQLLLTLNEIHTALLDFFLYF